MAVVFFVLKMEVPAYRRHYREQIHHLALQFVGIVFVFDKIYRPRVLAGVCVVDRYVQFVLKSFVRLR